MTCNRRLPARWGARTPGQMTFAILGRWFACSCLCLAILSLASASAAHGLAPNPPPAAPADTPIPTLGQLPSGREQVAAIYVPDQSAAYVFGGYDGAGSLDAIVRVNLATGEAVTLGVTLPEPRQAMSAVYVQEQRTAYLFGGANNGARLRSIVAFSVDEPYSVTTLSAQLTSNREASAAVYAPDRGLAYIFGGETSNGETRVGDKFDPFYPGGPRLTQLPSALWLPAARAYASAVYASQDGCAYVFGGYRDGIQSSIFKIDFDGGDASQLANDLPGARFGSAAAYSPETHLAYILGGAFSWLGLTLPSSSLYAVELHDGQSYITQLDLPEPAYYLAAVYASVERKVCTFGGHSVSPYPAQLATIACFPVSLGPAVDIGRWENVRTLGAGVTGIAPHEPANVWFATDGDGAWLYNSSSWTHYTNASTGGGLGTNSLTTAAHGDGYAWFGTQSLGARFRQDGFEIWSSYRAPNLGSDWVRSIELQPGVDSDDPVRWFATSNGLSRRYWNPATSSFTWQTLRTANGLADNRVWDLDHEQGATANSTYLWIATSYGAQRFRGGASGGLLAAYNGVDAHHYADACNDPGNSLFWDIAYDVAVGLDGRKWFAIAQGFDGPFPMGLCELSGSPVGDNWRPVRYNTLSSDDVRDIAVDGEGRVWLATVPVAYLDQPGGATALEYDKLGILYTAIYSTTNSPLRSNSLWSVGGTQERVYFGSSSGHVDAFAPRWNFFDPSNSDLGSDDFYDVWTALGRLWLRGAGNLLLWLEPDGASVGSRDMGYGVRSLASDGQNRLWVGTYQGGIFIKDGDSWSQLTTADGLPDDRVFALLPDRQRPGWMWVGSEAGLGVWTGDRWLKFTTANSGLPDNQVRSLAEDRRGRIWMGTYGGGVAVYDKGAGWTVYDTSDGLADNYIGDLVIDGDGHVWADGQTTSGVSEWDGAWSIHDSSDGLPSSIQELAVDEQGRLWIGATRGAAVRQEGGWLLLQPANSGLARNSIEGMAADGGGRVWFVHGANGGLSVRGTLNGPLGVAVPRIDAFDPEQGTAGDIVVITGGGFDSRCQDFNEVRFGAARARVLSCSPTRLEVVVPPEARSGRISVQARRRTGISSEDFTAMPTVTYFTPSGGHIGVEVIIHGTNFARRTRVCFSGNCRDASGSPTTISVYVQSGDASGPISVRNLEDDTWDASPADFTVLNLSLNEAAFNQGIPSYELIKSEYTLMQIFLRSDVAPPPSAAIEIDEVLVEYQDASDEWVTDHYPSTEFNPPLTPGAWDGDTPPA
ncbi:MAG: IPT/TIG domain-containing protein, partial [Anaerolineales bacterium]|nr:IPT/TIG domain-containing protein [Anaerolineales bacterium]